MNTEEEAMPHCIQYCTITIDHDIPFAKDVDSRVIVTVIKGECEVDDSVRLMVECLNHVLEHFPAPSWLTVSRPSGPSPTG